MTKTDVFQAQLYVEREIEAGSEQEAKESFDWDLDHALGAGWNMQIVTQMVIKPEDKDDTE